MDKSSVSLKSRPTPNPNRVMMKLEYSEPLTSTHSYPYISWRESAPSPDIDIVEQQLTVIHENPNPNPNPNSISIPNPSRTQNKSTSPQRVIQTLTYHTHNSITPGSTYNNDTIHEHDSPYLEIRESAPSPDIHVITQQLNAWNTSSIDFYVN